MNTRHLAHTTTLLAILVGLHVAGVAHADLIAEYPFNGNANDATGNGNNGTVVGATLVPDRYGNPASAYSFAGGGLINCGNGPAFQFGNSDFTLCAWVYKGSAPTQFNEVTLIAKEAIYEQASQFRLSHTANYLYFEITDQSGEEGLWGHGNGYQLRAQLPLAQWTHVAVVRSGLNFKLLLNGQVVSAAVSPTDVFQSNAHDLLIGARHNNSGGYIEHFPGMIDDVRVYNHALSEAEVFAMVYSPCELIERLMLDIEGSSLSKNKQPLLVSLVAACESIERGNTNAAINQLQAFQNKVRAQVAKQSPTLADAWIQAAQKIIEQLRQPEADYPKGKVLHLSGASGSGQQLVVFDTVTKSKMVIPGVGMDYLSTPTWSPDGQWVAFSGGPAFISEIYKVRPDGTVLTALTAGGNDFVDPDWCPCGTKIAFQRAGGGSSCYVNIDGSGLTQLPVGLGFLRWSPDGSKLVGSNWGWESYESTLSLYDVATGIRTVITPYQPGQAYQRSNWSPDGQRLVAGKLNQTTLLGDVVVMNADGSGEANLTADMPGTDETNPTWSPDGKWVLFMSNAAHNWDVWAMRPDGSSKMNLTQSPEDEVGPPDFHPAQGDKKTSTAVQSSRAAPPAAPTGLRIIGSGH